MRVSDILTTALALADQHPDALYQAHGRETGGYLTGTVTENGKVIAHGCLVGNAITALAGEVPPWLAENPAVGIERLTEYLTVDSPEALTALAVMENANDDHELWRSCGKLAREYLERSDTAEDGRSET